MPNISVMVREKIAQTQGTPEVVCGNSDYVVMFDFDDEWDEYDKKTARFVWYDNGAQHWIDAPITDGVCIVPKLERTNKVEIGVYAGNISTSTGAIIPCIWSITDIPAVMQPPEHDFYNELMEQINKVL